MSTAHHCPLCHTADLLAELARIHPYLDGEVDAIMVWVRQAHLDMSVLVGMKEGLSLRVQHLTHIAAKAEHLEHQLALLKGAR